jgi:hypothetical protein
MVYEKEKYAMANPPHQMEAFKITCRSWPAVPRVHTMKDSELRGLVLQAFYDHRRSGYVGLGTQGVVPLQIPGMDANEIVRISRQLSEHGLIQWKGPGASRGDVAVGVGRITIHIDQSQHVQNIHIEGQHGGVQVAGAYSNQQQSVRQDIEKLISAIDGANVSEAEKKEAKGLLAKFLQSSAVGAILGPVVGALLKHYGL